MVQKGKIRGEWVESYLAGNTQDVPAEFLDEVRALASRQKAAPVITVAVVEDAEDKDKDEEGWRK